LVKTTHWNALKVIIMTLWGIKYPVVSNVIYSQYLGEKVLSPEKTKYWNQFLDEQYA
jgi:hypothetical protein